MQFVTGDYTDPALSAISARIKRSDAYERLLGGAMQGDPTWFAQGLTARRHNP